ncbi:hypothetical protein DRE_06237 [Drechslerella stenobrocha 248]|uniref:Uncharacterized protein n=1 Tax=Drechslerella stenobrocha 248 TaxID=1043628 RepID=W7HYT5_9PEZI|nr:hypothetical protein DRE_06237 [Drechslerella stenobrocha 248]
MEGVLSIPPGKNLLNRGNWKTRYVVLGPLKTLQVHNTSAPRKLSLPEEDLGAVEDVFGNQADDDLLRFSPSSMRLSLYRQKLDSEPLASYPLEYVTSCYVGDIAHRKAFSSMSKTTYNPLCPTLVVNVQLPPGYASSRRRGAESPTAIPSQLPDPDEGKLTLFFRSGPRDTPPLTIWCREIQAHIRTYVQSRRSSAVTFGGDKLTSRLSHRPTAYDLKLAEDEWEDERESAHNHPSASTTRSSEESCGESSSRGSGTAGAPRPISTMITHEFGRGGQPTSMNQSPVDPYDASPSVGSDYMACASMSGSPRRETILDRAFSMNYIPSSPTMSSSSLVMTPIGSVARFEAVAADPNHSREYRSHQTLDLDPSVMPASFFQ